MKRVKIFEFSLGDVEGLLHAAMIDPPLPPDATVRDFHVDWMRQTMQVLVASGMYPEVPENSVVPREGGWRIRRIRADGSVEP